MYYWYAKWWKTVWSFLKKCKINLLLISRNSTSRYILKRTQSMVSKRWLYTCVHSSIIHNSQRVDTTHCPSMQQGVSNMWLIHTMEYYPALKRKTFPTRATTKMNLEDIMLSKISQSLKDIYCMISLKMRYRVVKFIEIESRMMAKGSSEGEL